MAEQMSALVTTEWLADRLGEPSLRIVDGSFKMPGVTPTTAEDFQRRRIPGAVFFDIDEIADHESSLPHMLPQPEQFAAHMQRLGIGDGTLVVVYDGAGITGAARVWWTLRAFGHDRVAVLDGGLRKWLAEGRAVEEAPPAPAPRAAGGFTGRPVPALVRDYHQMLANIDSRREQVIDARAAARFRGEAAEPRAGLRSGHIPGSRNLDYATIVDGATGTLLDPAVLRQRFLEAGVDLDRPIATSCGSGVSASVLALGLHVLGRADVAVYDGSWTEWGRETAPPGRAEPLPIETGAATR